MKRRLVVRSHNPLRVRLFTALLAVAIVVSGWALFEYGRERGGYDAVAAQRERADLEAANAAQMTRNRELRERVAVLERSRDIESEAYRHLEGTVAALQDEILELKEELEFYRGIVSPSDGHEGLKLQNFELTRGRGARQWRYRVVLTQVLNNDNVVAGAVRLAVEGVQDGSSKRLSLSEVAEGKDALAFRFRYFQDFEGELTLPEGFTPVRAAVTVDPRGKGRERLERTFEWPVEES